MDPSMHSTMQQYDDATWQALQDLQAGSQSGAEVAPEMSNAPDPQLLIGSAFYNTFPASQPLQPIEGEAPSYPLENLRPHASTTPWTDDQSLQAGEHLQSFATQQPGLPLEDRFVLQPFMNDNIAASKRGQILGEFSEFQNVFNPGMAADQVYHTNPCMHLGTQTSTLEYGNQDTDFSTCVFPDPVSQTAPTMSNCGDLYGPVPKDWSTPQPWQLPSDPSSFLDPSQQLNLSNFNAGPSQVSLENYPTQLQYSPAVATSLGSSSHHFQGVWPETCDQTYQFGSQGIIPSQDIVSVQSGFPSGYDDLGAVLPTSSSAVLPCELEATASDAIVSSAQMQPRTALKKTKRKRTSALPFSSDQQGSASTITPSSVGETWPALEIEMYTGPGTRSEQPRSRKKFRNFYGKVKSACFLCRFKKRECVRTNNGLCRECESVVRRMYGSQFQLPRFTCNLRTKLAELTVFSNPIHCNFIDKLRNTTFGASAHSNVTICIYRLLKPFLAILDDLEPSHYRRFSHKHTTLAYSSLAYYSYSQSVVRWKRVFLHYVPDVAELLDVVAMLHRSLLYRILRSIDRTRSDPDTFSTCTAVTFLRRELPSLRLCESVDQAAVEHLSADLDHRCMVLYSVLAATHSVTQETNIKELKGRLILSGNFNDSFEYWPPSHCKNGRGGHHKDGREEGCSDYPQPPALDVQPTPLQYTQAAPTCFTSAIMCWLPSHALALLDIDMETLAKDICKPDGLIQRECQPWVEICSKSDLLGPFSNLVRLFISISMESYFDALTLEMRSEDWQAKCGRHVHGRFRQVERAIEASLLVRTFIGISRNLLQAFSTSEEIWALETGISQGDVDRWVDNTEIGKKATKRLKECILELVKNPVWVKIMETEGNQFEVICSISNWKKVSSRPFS